MPLHKHDTFLWKLNLLGNQLLGRNLCENNYIVWRMSLKQFYGRAISGTFLKYKSLKSIIVHKQMSDAHNGKFLFVVVKVIVRYRIINYFI